MLSLAHIDIDTSNRVKGLNMDLSRREILKISAVAAIGYSMKLGAQDQIPKPNQSPTDISPYQLARDEKFWKRIAIDFDVDSSFINLENGYYGLMPAPIYEKYLYNTQRLNRSNSFYLRKTFKTELESAREYLAKVLRVPVDEIAFTRGGTEALQNLISGFNKLNPGDQVLYADLDYYSCQYVFNSFVKKRGVSLVKINIPEPANKSNVIDTYAQALEDHPSLKLILLTHINNRTGLVLPVKEIVDLARQKGVDVIVDAAHSWGQLDFCIDDLNADFVILSLHKWIHAPLGLGCMYVRKNRLKDIDRCLGDELFSENDIRSRVHSGTMNVAPVLTLPSALDYHLSIGAQAKQERLRYLRDHWVSRVSALESIEILTPNQTEMYGGITSFRFKGRTTKTQNDETVDYLFNKHRIFTVQRGGIYKGDCVRVTPALFTGIDDVEKLAIALTELAQHYRS
jgi:selenocysteine lyase/cysteine desulfurase